MLNPVIKKAKQPKIDKLFAEMAELIARAEEEEKLERLEAANRTENIASWRYDEEPDPCER